MLREHEAGAKTADLARKHGVSEATLYNWKAKFGGMDVSEAKRLKAARGRERQAEEASGRADAGCGRASRASVKKMVGPAAKREARRASAGRDGPVGTAGLLDRRRGSQDGPLPLLPAAGHGACGRSCASLPMNAGGSATAGCSSCCGRRASRRASTASTGSIAKKALRCASGGPGAAPWARGRRSWSRQGRMPAGRWISSMTSSPAAGASAS